MLTKKARERLETAAWIILLTAFLFLGWVATWAHWLEGAVL